VNRRRPEYLVVDIETIPDTTRWERPEVPHGVQQPFPPTWAHRIIVIGCLWLDADYRLKRLGVVGEEIQSDDPDEREGQLPRASRGSSDGSAPRSSRTTAGPSICR
jgi:hypothetical protein